MPSDARHSPARTSAPADGALVAIDGVVSHHMNPFASGVAKFNATLARELGVPCLRLDHPATADLRAPLLSFKVSELSAREQSAFGEWLDGLDDEVVLRLFLHDFTGTALEVQMLDRAAVIFSGNAEISSRLEPDDRLVAAWTPGLVEDHRRFVPAELSVFSFGMAHKIRVDMFERLRGLLDASGRSYAIHISAATHETSNAEHSRAVFDEMHELFPVGLYFLGELSDVAVHNQLLETTFFAAFFRDGVRANNTSIVSALEHGAVVITNLDAYSPPELVHMDNVIDIARCDALPLDPLTLRRISVRAMETAQRLGWADLTDVLRRPPLA